MNSPHDYPCIFTGKSSATSVSVGGMDIVEIPQTAFDKIPASMRLPGDRGMIMLVARFPRMHGLAIKLDPQVAKRFAERIIEIADEAPEPVLPDAASASIVEFPPLASVIRRRRCTLNMTQESLAKCVGYSSGHISKIETGASIPHDSTLSAIAHALGLEPGLLSSMARTARRRRSSIRKAS